MLQTPVRREQVAAVRRFNRFYTQQHRRAAGGLARQPVLAHRGARALRAQARDRATASDIGRELGLDAGYLSRILRRFAQDGLIRKQPRPTTRGKASCR